MIYKNHAVVARSKASDQWNYYQAQSNKGHLIELAAETAPGEKQAYYRDQINKYEARKTETAAKSHQLELQVEDANRRSEGSEHPQHLFGQALALISVAISLAAVTSLTRSHRLFIAAGLAGLAGIGVAYSDRMGAIFNRLLLRLIQLSPYVRQPLKNIAASDRERS